MFLKFPAFYHHYQQTPPHFPIYSYIFGCFILLIGALGKVAKVNADELLLAGPNFNHREVLGQHSLGAIPKIHYSSRGYIWLASKSGLVRFDGNISKVFHHQKDNPDSLSSNDIWGISEDKKGNLWLSTYGGGVEKFDPITESFEHFNQQQGLLSNIAFSVHAASNGLIWVGTAKGLSLIDPEKKHTVDFEGQSNINSAVWSVLEDSQKRLWVGTSDGLYLIDQQKNIHHFSHQKNNFMSLSNNVIRTIYEDKKGEIWLGTDHGLNLYLDNGNGFKHYLHDPDDSNSISGNEIYSVFDDHLGQFWVGTFNKGLNRFDPLSGHFDRLNIDTMALGYYPESSAYSITEDDSGMLWMGSENGIVNIRLSGILFEHLTFRARSGKNIIDFAKNEKYILAISESTLFEIGSEQIHSTTPFINYSPLTSLTNASKDIWLGSFRHGLIRYNPLTKKVQQFQSAKSDLHSLPSNVVSTLLTDSDSRIWVGMYRDSVDSHAGIAKFNSDNETFERYLPGKSITGLIELDDDTLLIGTYYNGVELFDKKSGLSEPINLGENSGNKQVRGLFRDSLKRIWIVTQNSGFAEFIYKDKTVRFIADPEQIALTIKGIVSDNTGDLWLSTENGILQWHKQTGQLKKYGNTDGIQLKNFNERAATVGFNDELMFGSAGGVLRFDPRDINRQSFSPQVVINELRLFNKPVSVGELLPTSIDYVKSLVLTHDDYLFSLIFSALDYTAPGKIHYAYKLKGLDDNWIYTDSTNRMATYTALSPGDYTFVVKASNNDSDWIDNETVLHITILPPWWRTWFAYAVYLMIGSLLTLFIIQIRTRSLKQIAIKLQRGIEERTLKLSQKNVTISVLLEQKKRLFTNISHEFRTPLTLIINPIEQLLKEEKVIDEKSTLVMIKRNGLRLLKMVEQLLELARLESPLDRPKKYYSVKQVIKHTLASFEPLAQIKGQSLTIVYIDDVNVEMQPDSLELIITNLISNAVKYTPEGGKIEVSTKILNDIVEISVKDSGYGIKAQYHRAIFEPFHRGELENNEQIPGAGIGLALVKELVELHQGKIKLESQKDTGSVFCVSLPIIQSNYKPELESTFIKPENWIITAPQINQPTIAIIEEDVISDDNRPILLIVEDNADMQAHLFSILHTDYRCIRANNGYEGLELAKLQIPEIILCDVMMPKMDGYEFSQSIKQDVVLSHIPIMLLTARADLQSRMAGWHRHVDDYLTKPFNDKELKLRLDNILTIRNILRKRYASEMHNSRTSLVEIKQQLNILDQCFIERFESLIEKNYPLSEFQLTQAASCLAMSDRQLQRKLKAIMDLTFSDYVRSHRLNKAKQLLQDGLLVNMVLEEVGFSSASYFSSCFKAEFGKTPKQFQQEVILIQREN